MRGTTNAKDQNEYNLGEEVELFKGDVVYCKNGGFVKISRAGEAPLHFEMQNEKGQTDFVHYGHNNGRYNIRSFFVPPRHYVKVIDAVKGSDGNFVSLTQYE